LLANIYFNRFLKFWEERGMSRELRARVINYADDFVILSRGKAAEGMAWMRRVMAGLKLTVHPTKTCVRDARRESFDFLGYRFGPMLNKYEREKYLDASPSAKSVKRLKEKLSQTLAPWNKGAWKEVRAKVNRMLVGWSNYFRIGTLKKAYRAVDNYVYEKVRGFLRRRHKIASSGTSLVPTGASLRDWGIVRLRDELMRMRHSWVLR